MNVTDVLEEKIVLKNEIEKLGYMADPFLDSLEEMLADRKKKGRCPRRIRYDIYCRWALCLLKKKIGFEETDSSPQYSYPAEVLNFIRASAPGNIKGEIREDALKVDLGTFCKAMELPRK